MSTNGTKICLLDDDPLVLKATSRMLSHAGYRLQSFTDPIGFLAHARDHQPRVVVLDILMPAMNGLEVQRRLCQVSASTRVIILSSRDDPIVRSTAMHRGASAFFLKGGENKEFLAGVEAALKNNGHETSDTREEVSSISPIQSAVAYP